MTFFVSFFFSFMHLTSMRWKKSSSRLIGLVYWRSLLQIKLKRLRKESPSFKGLGYTQFSRFSSQKTATLKEIDGNHIIWYSFQESLLESTPDLLLLLYLWVCHTYRQCKVFILRLFLLLVILDEGNLPIKYSRAPYKFCKFGETLLSSHIFNTTSGKIFAERISEYLLYSFHSDLSRVLISYFQTSFKNHLNTSEEISDL